MIYALTGRQIAVCSGFFKLKLKRKEWKEDFVAADEAMCTDGWAKILIFFHSCQIPQLRKENVIVPSQKGKC